MLQLRSLTARLAVLFAMAAALIFAAVGGYLYRSLAVQLESRDDHELIGKVEQIRHLLTETPSVQSIRDDPHRFLDATGKHEGLIVILQTSDGHELLRNGSGPGKFPIMPFIEANQAPERDSIRTWLPASGRTARVISAWGQTGNPDEQVKITLGRTNSDRMDLLNVYRYHVSGAIIAGALFAALLGYAVVRKALLPVREIARQAHSISAQELGNRLNSESVPKELQDLVTSFNAVLDRLQESFQRLSQFSGDLAHDMRTPLNNLMIQTQVAISQQRSNDEYQALLGSNIEEYERMARMVESMLFLARADHAQVALDKQMFQAHDELCRIAEYFEGVAEDAGITCEVVGEATLLADPILFRRAVNNLMANAIRHTAQGGIIRLTAATSAESTVISIENPGTGIDVNHLPRLFDRFYRADQARTESASSAGLGLTIVQSIMHLHGGHVEVESVPHGTTTFRLVFTEEGLMAAHQ